MLLTQSASLVNLIDPDYSARQAPNKPRGRGGTTFPLRGDRKSTDRGSNQRVLDIVPLQDPGTTTITVAAADVAADAATVADTAAAAARKKAFDREIPR